MKYPKCPEVISTLKKIDTQGDEDFIGDKVCGIQVVQTVNSRDGILQLDVRDMDKKRANLIVEIPLPELIAAISCATLNADREE